MLARKYNFQMEHVNIITSFIAGLLMFLAPCTLPLVPGFIAFISHGERPKVTKNAFLFCLGFLATFLLFGILAGLLGHVLAPYKFVLQKVGAVIIMIFGLYLLGLFRIPLFSGSNIGEKFKNFYKGKYGAFFFGVSFALGWTPCVGPVLAGIFFFATFSYSVLWSLLLFFFFSLGFIVPFMIVAYLVQRGKNLALRSSKWFTIFAGLLLIFLGVLLFVDNFGVIAGFLYQALDFINYEKLNNLL